MILAGDRIAQVTIEEMIRPRFKEVDKLQETKRGSGGFGSTGR
jgi:dUTP pyrophosphatase